MTEPLVTHSGPTCPPPSACPERPKGVSPAVSASSPSSSRVRQLQAVILTPGLRHAGGPAQAALISRAVGAGRAETQPCQQLSEAQDRHPYSPEDSGGRGSLERKTDTAPKTTLRIKESAGLRVLFCGVIFRINNYYLPEQNRNKSIKLITYTYLRWAPQEAFFQSN